MTSLAATAPQTKPSSSVDETGCGYSAEDVEAYCDLGSRFAI
jgi:hypothetical protein